MNLQDLSTMADSAIALIKQQTPWLAQAVAGATVTKGVEELWDAAKRKLSSPGGQEALEKAATEPEKGRNWETVRNHMLDALEQDAEFRARLARLLAAAPASPATQVAIGDRNRQGMIVGSPGSKIKL